MPWADDHTLADGELLLRRVPSKWIVNDPKSPNGYRVSSAAFEDEEMSVDIASIRDAANEPWTTCLAGHEGYGLVSVTAGLVRAKGQMVCRDPLPENAAHGVVVGRKTGSVRNAFVKECVWVHDPRA